MALQLRLLQTVVAVAAEKNSTLVLPFPVELLRFLERAQQGPQPSVAAGWPQDGSGQPAPERPAEPAEPQSPVEPASPMDPDVVDPAVTAQTFTDQPLPDAPLTDGDTGPDGSLPEAAPDGVPEFDPETVPEFDPEPSGRRRGNPFSHH